MEDNAETRVEMEETAENPETNENAENTENREEKENKLKKVLKWVLIIAIDIIVIILLLLLICHIHRCRLDRTNELDPDPLIFIYNLDGTEWSDCEEIDVFYNETFGSNKIAPYSAGTYGFLLKNETDYTLEYNISLGEYNDYDIALCYRLKRDGSYLTDEYARIENFDCETLTIEKQSYHYFELEWYWDGNVSDVNDTLAGTNGSIYTLTITFTASAS